MVKLIANLNKSQVWLPAARGKGLEVTGTFTARNNQIFMEMTFFNKAMQAMTAFAIQFNKNRLVDLLIHMNYSITV